MSNSKEDIERSMQLFQESLKHLFLQKDELDKQIAVIREGMDAARNQYFDLLVANNEVTWDYLLDSHNEGIRKVYNELQKRLEVYTLHSDGFFYETMQRSIRIALVKNDPFSVDKTFAGLTEVLPFLKPVKHNIVYIGIMERHLSANGIYSLHVKDGRYTIVHKYYSREQHLKTFKDLRDALEYIQENYYYEDKLYNPADYAFDDL